MIQTENRRAGQLALRLAGIAGAATSLIAVSAAIRSAAEWQGLATLGSIVGFCAVAALAALIAQLCFARTRAGGRSKSGHKPYSGATAELPPCGPDP